MRGAASWPGVLTWIVRGWVAWPLSLVRRRVTAVLGASAAVGVQVSWPVFWSMRRPAGAPTRLQSRGASPLPLASRV